MKDPITNTSFNIRAEVLLMEWIERSSSIDVDDVSIMPDGGFNHMIRREISSIEDQNDAPNDLKYSIKLARKGIYDALPADLVHQHLQRTGESTVEERTRQIRTYRKQAQEARRFFSPFDQNLNRYRLKIEQEERKVLTGFPVSSSHTLFDILWGQFDVEMTNCQKSILFSILPMAHEISGSVEQICSVFEAMVNQPVKIQSLYKSSGDDVQDLDSLGDLKLSAGMILGELSDAKQLHYNVQVKDIPSSRATSFLPGGNQSELLSMLARYFIPFEVSVTFQYETVSSEIELLPDRPASMDIDEYNGIHRLGYSTQL